MIEPQATPTNGQNPQGLICGAKKRNGEPCRGRKMANGRCRIHGGKVPHGPALPQFKHGRYSAYVPPILAQAYEQARADPNRLALDDEIALTDARLAALLQRLDREPAPSWTTAHRLYGEFRRALAASDGTTAERTLDELGGVLRAGASDTAVYAELRATIDQRRKLVDTERKRIEAAANTLNAEQAMTLIATLAASVRAHVPDRKALAAITADLERVLNPKAV